MFTRRTLLGLAAGAVAVAGIAGTQLLSGAVAPALAGEKVAWNADAFAAAQAAGKPILVEIHATWCPTCRAQQPIISGLQAEPRFQDLVVFSVDFDSQKPVVRDFGAYRQSTLIAFKGGTEVGRSIADTNAASIEAMLDKTI